MDKSKLKDELWKYSWVRRMDFPRFRGDDVRGWLYKCEQFFRDNDVPDELKVSLVTINLFDIAYLWHEQIVKIIGEDVTWLVYKHAILQRFGNTGKMQILIKEILSQTGTVVEYYDAFKSLFRIVSCFSDLGEDEKHFVDLFIEGLCPKIGSVVRKCNPQSFWMAYILAQREESREIVDNDNGSTVLDDGVECEEIELRVSKMDGGSKSVGVVDGSGAESVEGASVVGNVSDCVMGLDDGCQETESRVCGLNDDMKSETNESLDSEWMVMEDDEFQNYEDGGEMNKSIVRFLDDEYGKCTLEIEKNGEDGLESLGSFRNDEVSKVCDESKGVESRRSSERNGFEAFDASVNESIKLKLDSGYVMRRKREISVCAWKPMVKMWMNGSIMGGDYRVSGITRESEVSDESKIGDNTLGGRVSLYQLSEELSSVKSNPLEDLLVVRSEVITLHDYVYMVAKCTSEFMVKTEQVFDPGGKQVVDFSDFESMEVEDCVTRLVLGVASAYKYAVRYEVRKGIRGNELASAKDPDDCTRAQNLWLMFWEYGLTNGYSVTKLCIKDFGPKLPELKLFYIVEFSWKLKPSWNSKFRLVLEYVIQLMVWLGLLNTFIQLKTHDAGQRSKEVFDPGGKLVCDLKGAGGKNAFNKQELEAIGKSQIVALVTSYVTQNGSSGVNKVNV